MPLAEIYRFIYGDLTENIFIHSTLVAGDAAVENDLSSSESSRPRRLSEIKFHQAPKGSNFVFCWLLLRFRGELNGARSRTLGNHKISMRNCSEACRVFDFSFQAEASASC
jgi:hypothetical protein